MSWIDVKYVNLLSNKLEQFKRKDEGIFNFRCPICGDSQTSKYKARGYIYNKGGKVFYRCHNCGAGMTARSFIETVDPELYKEYVKESFLESGHKKPTFEPDIGKFTKPKFKKKGPLTHLKTISQLAHDHPAKQYIVKRKIPNFFHSQLFYAPKFVAFTNHVLPGKLKQTPEHKRIIIPFFDQYHNLFGYQGRSIGKIQPKYLTIMIDEKPKIYGLDRVDFSKKNFIVEGPIDSMFLDNAVAMAGSDIGQAFDYTNSVFIFDNEPRSNIIIEKMRKIIDKGYNIFIWPENMKYKDINDAVLAGVEVKEMINQNTFSGLAAKISIVKWKRC